MDRVYWGIDGGRSGCAANGAEDGFVAGFIYIVLKPTRGTPDTDAQLQDQTNWELIHISGVQFDQNM